jgi:acyl carrier protein
MPEDEIAAQLVAFIRKNLQSDDRDELIDEATPLLESGILDSLKTAILLNYIRDELGTAVPPARIDSRNFRDVRSISAMVHELASAPTT